MILSLQNFFLLLGLYVMTVLFRKLILMKNIYCIDIPSVTETPQSQFKRTSSKTDFILAGKMQPINQLETWFIQLVSTLTTENIGSDIS